MTGPTVDSGRGGAGQASKELEGATEWNLDQHQEILDKAAALERTLEAAVGTEAEYVENVAGQLEALTKTLEHHFAHEDTSALYTTFVERFPRFSTALARLGREHQEILKEVRALASGFSTRPGSKNLRKLKSRLKVFIAVIRRHEAEEDEIWQRACSEDIGGDE